MTSDEANEAQTSMIPSRASIVASPATGPSGFFDLTPRRMVESATEIANVLTDIVDRQKLYSTIQGKKYPRVEAWVTMGSLMGILPRERDVRELGDGSYEAHVDLYSAKTGMMMGGASALCSIDEHRWKNADKYARRSMAITRATGKAYRLCFSWVMTLAGYQPTPAEEMHEEERREKRNEGQKTTSGFNPEDARQKAAMLNALEDRQVPEHLWDLIMKDMVGRPGGDLPTIIERASL